MFKKKMPRWFGLLERMQEESLIKPTYNTKVEEGRSRELTDISSLDWLSCQKETVRFVRNRRAYKKRGRKLQKREWYNLKFDSP